MSMMKRYLEDCIYNAIDEIEDETNYPREMIEELFFENLENNNFDIDDAYDSTLNAICKMEIVIDSILQKLQNLEMKGKAHGQV